MFMAAVLAEEASGESLSLEWTYEKRQYDDSDRTT
jgi:hypothetical protein